MNQYISIAPVLARPLQGWKRRFLHPPEERQAMLKRAMLKHTSKRILIASDSPLKALSIEGLLGAAGYRYVRATSDLSEIMRLYAKWPFALLILDMDVSLKTSAQVFDGFAAHAKSGRLSVLALTHEDGLALYARALHAGLLDVCTRPFTRAEMLARVADALDARPELKMVSVGH